MQSIIHSRRRFLAFVGACAALLSTHCAADTDSAKSVAELVATNTPTMTPTPQQTATHTPTPTATSTPTPTRTPLRHRHRRPHRSRLPAQQLLLKSKKNGRPSTSMSFSTPYPMKVYFP